MVIHLFRKDLRRLWMLVLAVSALAVIQAYVQGHQAPRFDELSRRWRELPAMLSVVTMFGWALLMVFAVQEDGLTGSDEDWLTRPVGWPRLLGAKLLFLAAVVMLPMTLSQFYIVWAQGFSPWAHLPGLLTRVLANTGVLMLPALALAAVTSNVAQAVLGGFLFVMAMAAFESSGVLNQDGLGELFWVRAVAGHWLIFTLAIGVALWQYSTRRTFAARAIATVAALLVIVGPASVTRAAARAVDQLRWNDRPGLQVRVADRVAGAPALRTPSTWEVGDATAWVALPLEVAGIEEPERIQSMGGGWELMAPDGDRTQSGQTWPELLQREVTVGGQTRYWLLVGVPKQFYERHQQQPLRMQGDVAFGVVRAEKPISLRPGEPVRDVPGVGRCSAYYSSITGRNQLYLECKNPFRAEAAMEAVLRRPQVADVHSQRQLSGQGMFHPMAWPLNLDPMNKSFAAWVEPSGVEEILATPLTGIQLVRRQLSVSGIQLKDYFASR